MKKINLLLIAAVCLFGTVATAWAQQNNTVYFIKGIPERNVYNPAFQPYNNVYIDFPVFPNFRLDLGNNSLNANDVIFNKDGRTMLFLDKDAGSHRNSFYDAMWDVTRIGLDFELNIIGFGFRVKKNYFSFDISEHITAGMTLPKDFMNLALNGMKEQKVFDFTHFGARAMAYTEVGFGWSRKLSNKVTVGAKLKYLMGQANVHTDFDDLTLTASGTQWSLNGTGGLYMSLPSIVGTVKNTEPDKNGNYYPDFENIADGPKLGNGPGELPMGDFIKEMLTANKGFGIDLGVTYRPLYNLELSAAITDLGFIRWTNNVVNANLRSGVVFDGLEGIDLNDINHISDQISAKVDTFMNLVEKNLALSSNPKAYTTALHTRINLGAEYSVCNDKIGFGLLSSNLIIDNTIYPDITASVNFRPAKWFNPSFSYSFMNGEWHSLGFGNSLAVGPFTMYLAIDNIPLSFTPLADESIPLGLPVYMKGINLQAGWVWAFGGPKKPRKPRPSDFKASVAPLAVPEPAPIRPEPLRDVVGIVLIEEEEVVEEPIPVVEVTPVEEPVEVAPVEEPAPVVEEVVETVPEVVVPPAPEHNDTVYRVQVLARKDTPLADYANYFRENYQLDDIVEEKYSVNGNIYYQYVCTKECTTKAEARKWRLEVTARGVSTAWSILYKGKDRILPKGEIRLN
ncbi:hypothetical protein SAMD00024442_31_22 [Candidatus Symbiothrix dinenymphae]|nr:hypothetical protein SAMD00024442_31_22 [Candidatus Symbiothrix dinenymphae]